MAKKKSKTQYISAGVHSGVSNATKRMTRAGYIASGDRVINQLAAHLAGKKTMITIPNPNKEESITGKPFIRVPGSVYFSSKANKKSF